MDTRIIGKKIVYFKTQKSVSNNYFKLLKNVRCCEEDSLELIANERSDASFQYVVTCSTCKKKLGKIDWNDNFIANIY